MKRIIIDTSLLGTRIALVNNNVTEELWVEKRSSNTPVGNVYKGKVVRILHGMQAAFVDIGLGRNGFLYDGDAVSNIAGGKNTREHRYKLREGDVILCQVAKDQFGDKGARITMNLSIPGRFLVMMPFMDHAAVSRRIDNESERERLVKLILDNRRNNYGYIMRTEGAKCCDKQLIDEMDELAALYESMHEAYLSRPAPSLIYSEFDVIGRTIRDFATEEIDEVVINDKRLHDGLLSEYDYLNKSNCKYFDGGRDIFDHYGVTREIGRLLDKKVPLKNGAYLVIDRTEALTVIDVNTGKYVGDNNLEETVYVTNCIAAEEIARQLRLRNIGGIIIIDFIDMLEEAHRNAVLDVLTRAISKDRVRTMLVGMTNLGLVELTRKKTRSMTDEVLLQKCPYCDGNGYVKSSEMVIADLKGAIAKALYEAGCDTLKIYVHKSVYTVLTVHRYLAKECEGAWRGKRIYLIPGGGHVEDYKIEPLFNNVISVPDEAKLLT